MADRSGLAPQMLYQGVQKESFGYKMLAAMGWQEGSGLVRFAVGAPLEGCPRWRRDRGALRTALGCRVVRYTNDASIHPNTL